MEDFFEDLKKELGSFLDTIESNLNICENLKNKKINVFLQKLINFNGQTNKIVFVGRQGSRKKEIIKELSKLLPSVCVIKDKSDNNALDNRGYEDETGKNATITEFMDPPFYNYSDELDNEILNNWCDANIFVVVTNAIGSIGDLDKNFLKEIANKVFVIKLFFIFTSMEKVSENERYQLTVQHTTNAIKIANEILSVPQENIPIFFTYNDQLNDQLVKCLSECTFEKSKVVKMFADSIHNCHEELKGIIIEISKQTAQRKWHEDKYPQGNQNAEDYLQDILGKFVICYKKSIMEYWKNYKFTLNLHSKHFLKYANENTENSIISKESLLSYLDKYWPESIEFINADLDENSDAKLNSMAFNTFMYYTNKQFKYTNHFSRNICDNIVAIFIEVHRIYVMNFHEYYNSDNAQSLINKCETLIDFPQQTENLLLIKEILCFFIFIELILILTSIKQINRYYFIYKFYCMIRCKESQFSKNMQLLEYIFLKINDFIEVIKNFINKTEVKERKSIIVEDETSSSFIQFNDNPNLVNMLNQVQDLIKPADIFNLDKSEVGRQFADKINRNLSSYKQ